MDGFNVGDRVEKLKGFSGPRDGSVGIVVVVEGDHTVGVEFNNYTEGHGCISGGEEHAKPPKGWFVPPEYLKLLEEGEDMSQSKKNFRNGDIVRVNDPKKGVSVFVKFGENYYNLSENKQMKGYRFLPPGEKETLTNLGGMGDLFLMDEQELNKHLDVGDDTQEENIISEDEMPSHFHGEEAGSVFSAADLEKLFRSAYGDTTSATK